MCSGTSSCNTIGRLVVNLCLQKPFIFEVSKSKKHFLTLHLLLYLTLELFGCHLHLFDLFEAKWHDIVSEIILKLDTRY